MLTTPRATTAPVAMPVAWQRPSSLARSMRRMAYGLLLVFVFTIPSTSTVVVSPSLGTISRLVGVAMTLPALVALVVGGARLRLHDIHRLMAAWVLWAAASWYWTLDRAGTAALTDTAFQLLLLVYLVWEFGSDDRRWERLLWAYVLGCYVGALQVINAAISGTEYGQGRFTASEFNPGDLASILVLGLPGAWYLGIRARSGLARLLARLYLPVGITAIVLTASRASVLAVAVAIAVVPLTVGWLRWPARVLFFAATVAIGIAALQIVPEETIARIQSVSTEIEEGGTLNGRLPLWSATLDVMEERPILGAGAGALRVAIGDVTGSAKGAHNTYLAVGGELGFVGLSLFLLILLVAGLQAMSLARLQRIYATTTLSVLCVTLLALHSHYAKSTWVIIALVIAPASPVFRRDPDVPTRASAGRRS